MRTISLCLLTILCLMLAAVPAVAGALYSNGPINGTTDAWTINFGFSVSDSFTCSGACNPSDLHIGVWLFPGDQLTSVEMQLGSSSFGNQYTDQVLNATGHTDLGINQFGYDIQQIDFFFAGVSLPAGTSWITLQNATVPSGDPVYWDENSGPSLAYENGTGSIPSEAFTITAPCCGTTPEPSSILLFGSGILGLAGVLRRKLNR